VSFIAIVETRPGVFNLIGGGSICCTEGRGLELSAILNRKSGRQSTGPKICHKTLGW